ncbi:MAG: hypothetical protein HYZ37_02655 [Candidatus Solibacter usitatus]|nr:hypothetical protein [Candidatus Solibacter usitatus]
MFLLWIVFLVHPPARAEFVRMEVAGRGDAAGYERVNGKAYFAVDPKHRLNRNITDIELAVRNPRSKVEFSADFHILRPKSGGNGMLLFEASNRGGRGLQGTFNRGRGDEFLLHQGYTLVWLGWQHDVSRAGEGLKLYVPAAKGVKGPVRAEYVPNQPSKRMPLGDARHDAYTIGDPSTIRLTVRDTMLGPRRGVTGWRIEKSSLVLDAGFEPGKLYDAIYESQDPPLAMLGLAGIRDFLSHLRTTEQARFVLGFGSSQSAMLLRALLYHGFNEDESGKRVFDGILANIAGGRRSFLGRFAQPSRTAAPLRGMFYRTDEFPFADQPQKDPVTGVTDGVLAHLAPAMIPKIFYTNSAYEYWGSSGSLIHTAVDGKSDAALPPSTRTYMFAGGQHGPSAFPPNRGNSQNMTSPNDYRWSLRALLLALTAWVAEGKTPPASRYPKIADGTLVPVAKLRKVHGIPQPDHQHPSFRIIGASEPPQIGEVYGALVPQVDADGNDIAGVRMPEVAVPLATYTGWNLRAAAIGQPSELAGGAGSFLPFSPAKILERYGSEEKYFERWDAAARKLVEGGYLLDGDVNELRKAAKLRWLWALNQK